MKALRDVGVGVGACCATAGAGTESLLDYGLVALAAAAILYAAYKAIRHTVWPGEQSRDHIKRRILDEDDRP